MDFYIKYIGDPNYEASQVQTNGEIEELIQQIDTILFTNKREVLGEANFGCSLEDLIYSFNVNEFELQTRINEQINQYCPLATKYQVSTEVSFLKGTVRDIAYIDITVDSKWLVQLNIR